MQIEKSSEQPIRCSDTVYYAATFTGNGEFYSGIRNNERVLLAVRTQVYTNHDGNVVASVSMSIQKREGSAWLSLYNHTDQIKDVNPWSDEIHGRGIPRN